MTALILTHGNQRAVQATPQHFFLDTFLENVPFDFTVNNIDMGGHERLLFSFNKPLDLGTPEASDQETYSLDNRTTLYVLNESRGLTRGNPYMIDERHVIMLLKDHPYQGFYILYTADNHTMFVKVTFRHKF